MRNLLLLAIITLTFTSCNTNKKSYLNDWEKEIKSDLDNKFNTTYPISNVPISENQPSQKTISKVDFYDEGYEFISPYPPNKYYDVKSKYPFNLRKGNNRIMAGAFFILLSGATSITHFLIRDASPDIHTTLTIASVTFNMTAGAFILSGARKNKKESEKIRFIRDK